MLGAVLDHSPVARSTVARLTGLSPATVGGHVARLLDRGLLRESGPVAGGPRGLGRPYVPLEIDTGRHLVAGAHIAVTDSTVSLMDLRGRIVAQERRPHGAREPEVRRAGAGDPGPGPGARAAGDLSAAARRPALDPGPLSLELADRLRELTARHAGGRSVLALGVATGYRVDPGAGVVVEHPRLGWRDVPLRRLLGGATGLPVHVDSHARALARAEQLVGGAARRGSSLLLLFVGAVVDAAFATRDAVHRGPRFGAGSVAHLPLDDEDGPAPAERCACGAPRCLQSLVSEPTVLARARAEGLAVASFRDLLALALAGDGRAVRLLRRRARLVGRATAVLLDLFDPEVVVVVEPGSGRLPGCMDDLRAEVAARSWLCEDPERSVVPSSFTGSVLPVAGAAVALGALYADPLGPWPHLPAVS